MSVSKSRYCPLQVQVIQQAMQSPTFMPQFYNQQQLMQLQNMQGMRVPTFFISYSITCNVWYAYEIHAGYGILYDLQLLCVKWESCGVSLSLPMQESGDRASWSCNSVLRWVICFFLVLLDHWFWNKIGTQLLGGVIGVATCITVDDDLQQHWNCCFLHAS